MGVAGDHSRGPNRRRSGTSGGSGSEPALVLLGALSKTRDSRSLEFIRAAALVGSRRTDPRAFSFLPAYSAIATASVSADRGSGSGYRFQLVAVACAAGSDEECAAACRSVGSNGNQFTHDSRRTDAESRDCRFGYFFHTGHSRREPHDSPGRIRHRRNRHRVRRTKDAGESVRRTFGSRR